MGFKDAFSESIQRRLDNWQNVLTGVGTALRDKLMATEFVRSAPLTSTQLENLYHQDDTVALAVETLPEEMLRQGYDVKVQAEEDGESTTEIEADIATTREELEDITKFTEAGIWARLYGGAAILPIIRQSGNVNLAERLDENSIEEIEGLNVIESPYIIPRQWYEDPTQKKYGLPKTYSLTPWGERGAGATKAFNSEIHESRMILFDGTRVSAKRRVQNRGFSESVIQRSYDTIRQYAAGWASAGHLLTDSHQGVFKMDGLLDMIASDQTDLITKRMQVVEMGRSVARALVLDADKESFERQATDFSGIDRILQMLVLRASSSLRIPATIFMGQSPAGENATGESDFRWFLDKTKAQQISYLKPKLRRFIRLLLLSKEGPTSGVEPTKWTIEFRPLREMSQIETAQLRNQQANTDKTYFDMGVVLPEEIGLSRFKPDGWSMETVIDLDLRKAMLELNVEKELKKAEEPPKPLVPPVPPVVPVLPGKQPIPPTEPEEEQTPPIEE